MPSRAELAGLALVALLAVPFHARALERLYASAYEGPDADLVLLHRSSMLPPPPLSKVLPWPDAGEVERHRADSLEGGTPYDDGSPLRGYLDSGRDVIVRPWLVYHVDSIQYVELAASFCTGEVDLLHYRLTNPLYPLVAAPFFCPSDSVMGMVVPNVLMMAGSFLLLHRILGRLGLGRAARAAAMGWMALSPLPLHAFTVMSESANLFFYLLLVDGFLSYWSEGDRRLPPLLAVAALFLLGRPNNVLLYLSLALFGHLRWGRGGPSLLLPLAVLLPLAPSAFANYPLAQRANLTIRMCSGYRDCLLHHLARGALEVGASCSLGLFLPDGWLQVLDMSAGPAYLAVVLGLWALLAGLAALELRRGSLWDGPLSLLWFQLAAVLLYFPVLAHHVTYRYVIYGTPLVAGLVVGSLSRHAQPKLARPMRPESPAKGPRVPAGPARPMKL